MEPGIKRSITEGFRAANRSWMGIAVYVAGLLIVGGIAFGGLMLSNPPAEVFEEQPLAGVDEGVLGDELGAPVVDAAGEAQREAQARAIGDWFGRAWFLIVLALLIAMAGNLLLSGGQIGYVSQQVLTQQAPISTFWVVGMRAFVPLLLGSGLIMAGAGALALVAGGLGALAAVLPDAIGGVLVILLMVAAGIGLLWLLVRLAFWFIVIVAEQAGPVKALKTSFQATKGRWWNVFALGLIMVVISYIAQLPFALVDWISGLVGGGVGGVLSVIVGLAGSLVSLYVGFITLGAYVRFYTDTKSSPAGSAAPVGSPGPV